MVVISVYFPKLFSTDLTIPVLFHQIGKKSDGKRKTARLVDGIERGNFSAYFKIYHVGHKPSIFKSHEFIVTKSF